MSWNDFYRRRDALTAVLEQARRNPQSELPFTEIPGANELFGTEQHLLLALHHQWTQTLSGYLRTEAAGPDDAHTEAGDRVDAVSRAWRNATKRHETLRAVLDAHIDDYPAVASLHQAEQRMLAITAGLAEAGEPIAEIARVGVAFDALLRNGPDRPARRRSPVGQLLRLLAPSA